MLLKMPVLLIEQFLIYGYFYDAKKLHKLLAIASYSIYGIVGESVICIMSEFVFHISIEEAINNPVYTIFFVLFIYTVIGGMCELAVIFVNRRIKHVLLNMEYLAVAISVYIFVFTYNCSAIILYLGEYKEFSFMSVVVGTLVGSMIAFFFLSKHITLQKEREAEQRFIGQQIMMQQQHYLELKQKYIDIRKLQHDFKNHLQTIQSLNNIHAEDEMRSYIYDLTDSLRKTVNITFCGNAAVDAVLYNKKQYAESRKTDITINSISLDGIKASDMDLCSIIYNLLDNAIESCEKVSSDKYIIFDIHRKGAYLVLECRNSCAEYTPYTGKNNKDLHGWGMKIIKSLAEKYNGNDYCVFKNNEFVHIVNIDCYE